MKNIHGALKEFAHSTSGPIAALVSAAKPTSAPGAKI